MAPPGAPPVTTVRGDGGLLSIRYYSPPTPSRWVAISLFVLAALLSPLMFIKMVGILYGLLIASIASALVVLVSPRPVRVIASACVLGADVFLIWSLSTKYSMTAAYSLLVPFHLENTVFVIDLALVGVSSLLVLIEGLFRG